MKDRNVSDLSEPEQRLISCIVPVFNGEKFLSAALDSIYAQTWRPIEVIVVDDGSTDGTKDVVAQYAGRLVYVRQQNAGQAAARNRGLAIAQGEFVAFLDADDLWHPEKLARQMACFMARPALEMCITYEKHFWEKESEEEAQRLATHNHPWARGGLGLVCQALLARRHVFDTVGGFDPALRRGEDTDWFARTEERGIVREILPEILVYRRRHNANLTQADARGGWLEVVAAKLQRRQNRTSA
jgi:glycosyltransferase involved in cell wall biosynthesis